MMSFNQVSRIIFFSLFANYKETQMLTEALGWLFIVSNVFTQPYSYYNFSAYLYREHSLDLKHFSGCFLFTTFFKSFSLVLVKVEAHYHSLDFLYVFIS